MKYGLFSIMDKVAVEYSPPFTAKNEGMAQRAYQNELQKGLKPQEFTLWKIADYDSETGKIYNCEPSEIPFMNATASDIFKQVEEENNGKRT